MRIISSEFNNYEFIPSKFTCDGDNINPAIEFLDVPETAKSLVLMMEDLDDKTKTLHWLVWNIDPKTVKISKNSVPFRAIQGRNSYDKIGYSGPCPASGTHLYKLSLYALSTVISLTDVAEKADVEREMEGYKIEKAELVGCYERARSDSYT